MVRNDDEDPSQLSLEERASNGRSKRPASEKWKRLPAAILPVQSWKKCLNSISKIPTPWWNRISIISSVIGVSADPLFFYVPFIDDDNKCIGVDKKLRIIVILLRTLTDTTTVVHIMHHIRKTLKHVESESIQRRTNFNQTNKFTHKYSLLYLVFQILIVLPIPQVLVLVVFFRMRGDRYFEERMMMNLFLLVQYLPRMYQIYLISKKLTKHIGILLKGVFYLFMYILASHILGAFFYFFSIQRVTSCWHQTCRNTGGCTRTYYCGDHASTSVNITMLTELCPIPPNATMFDFGIFDDGLQSGNLGPISFLDKLLYFVWWGLRNLSNFGTNLETSSYLWENCFAILVSVLGLLLFLYLIGNVQQCMQWEAEKDEVLQMLKMKKEKIEFWMNDKEVPENLKKEIMADVDLKSEENKGADLEDLFSILSDNPKTSLKRHLCMDMLNNVLMLQGQKNVTVVNRILNHLEPVTYEAGSFFVKMDEPLDRFILVTDGIMLVYTSTNNILSSVEENGVYGDEQLLSWAFKDTSHLVAPFANLPISTENVKCMTKVKGFEIRADKLGRISMFKNSWNSIDSSIREEMMSQMTLSSIPIENSPSRNHPSEPTWSIPTLDVDPACYKGL